MTDEFECAIPMCGQDEGTELFPCCENGHKMHMECMHAVMKTQTPMLCPMCRSGNLHRMFQSGVVIGASQLQLTPYSEIGAYMACCIGVKNRGAHQ